MTRIIIAGSRVFNNEEAFMKAMGKLVIPIDDDIEIISGGCSGADEMGEKFARSRYYRLAVFPAKWNEYGRAAGPIRNEEMAKYAAAADRGILIAFPIGESRGTRNMIKLAKQYGLEVEVVES